MDSAKKSLNGFRLEGMNSAKEIPNGGLTLEGWMDSAKNNRNEFILEAKESPNRLRLKELAENAKPLPIIDWDKEFEKAGFKIEKAKPMEVCKPKPTEGRPFGMVMDWALEMKKAQMLEKKAKDKKLKINSDKKQILGKQKGESSAGKTSVLNTRINKRPLESAGSAHISTKKRKTMTTVLNTASSQKAKPQWTNVVSSSKPKVKKNLFGAYTESKMKIPTVYKKQINTESPLGNMLDDKPLPDTDGNSSTDTFEQLERDCFSCDKVKQSPLSLLTSKLKCTSITNKNSDAEQLKEDLLNCVETYKKRFNAKMDRMRRLQREMEIDKENFVSEMSRKLEGLCKRSVLSTPKNDLRIETLNKNLQKSVGKDVGMEKATRIYNGIRKQLPILNTPKTNRKELQETNGEQLSTKFQQQCLMLMDTPKLK